MMSTIASICVYCGSSNAVAPRYLDLAERLGRACGARGVRLVYGGGNVGLMGAAARTAADAGAQVLGVMPRFLTRVEQPGAHTVLVDTMHERKQRMFEESDGFVVLPGGVGTLEEVVETLSWRRLGLHEKPTVFVDLSFWAPFFAMLDHTVATGFTPARFREAYAAVDTPEEAFDALDRLGGLGSPFAPQP